MANNTPQILEVYKETSSLGRLLIKPVDKALAKEMIVKNHYSHKWNDGGFGVFNFGIFHADEPDRCLGVAVYGYMKNPKARIFTHPNPKAWMCELNRMWIDDELGHNAESILIATSIKMLRRIDPNLVAVQSFADGRLGCGTIYKSRKLSVLRLSPHKVPAQRAQRRNGTRADIHQFNVAVGFSPRQRWNVARRLRGVRGQDLSLHLSARQAFPLCKASETLSGV